MLFTSLTRDVLRPFLLLFKPKTLRKLVQQTFKEYASLSVEQCVFQFFEQLEQVWRFDREYYKCALGVCHTLRHRYVIGTSLAPTCHVMISSCHGLVVIGTSLARHVIGTSLARQVISTSLARHVIGTSWSRRYWHVISTSLVRSRHCIVVCTSLTRAVAVMGTSWARYRHSYGIALFLVYISIHTISSLQHASVLVVTYITIFTRHEISEPMPS